MYAAPCEEKTAATQPTRVALYVRVSAEQDAQAQLVTLRQQAARRGFLIYKEYVDRPARSRDRASTHNARAYRELLSDADRRAFDCVLVSEYSQIAGCLHELVDALAQLSALALGFISCAEDIDTTQPSGRLFYHVVDSFAEFEHEAAVRRAPQPHRRVPVWLIPALFCVLLYWHGIFAWFVQDDFAWLGLRHRVTDFRSFLWAMFAPLAQGTIRPLSERGFFMLFSWLFGAHALPFRIFAIANQCVNLALFCHLARKLTGSRFASAVAPVLWVASPALVIPMMWTSSYNEIQCATFILLSLYLLIRYTETGDKRFFWGQCLSFCAGLASNELDVVYPAIAAVYLAMFARKRLPSVAPMLLASVAFFVLDRKVAGSAPGIYAVTLSPRAAWSTLQTYVWIPFSGVASGFDGPWSHVAGPLLAGTFLALVIALVLWRALRRDLVPAFGLAWFLILLSPFLLLPNHVTGYYDMIPGIGLALAAAQGVSLIWDRGWLWRLLAGLLLAAYLVPSSLTNYRATVFHYLRAERARSLVEGVVAAKRQHPRKMILLRGIDEALFWSAIYDRPFARIFGWRDVLLAPEVRTLVKDDPTREALDSFFLPASAARAALKDGSAVAYSVHGTELKETTHEYAASLRGVSLALSRFLDAGSPYSKAQLGDGWFDAEKGARWSGTRAVVFLAGPESPRQKLHLSGWVSPQSLAKGPLHVMISIDGVNGPIQTIAPNQTAFQFGLALPAATVGRARIEIVVAVDRATRVPPDQRDLGLEFGTFSIQ